MHLIDGVLRAQQVIAMKLNDGVIDRLLENLPSYFEEFGSKWFGLTHYAMNRRFQEISIDRTLDPQQPTEM
ncbi:hypothetical protein MCEL_41050 [Mycolicibacterium celeriflavum]|uniref:Uncharacterized protein n=1 Tax=Mycolicibacterium celeriflavum TaxID=1249101 RepID=A0A7I7RNB3_MYCCF|nr:hypothetical protein MCEL_41050 [Mycolicibacterium celeriflavum]